MGDVRDLLSSPAKESFNQLAKDIYRSLGGLQSIGAKDNQGGLHPTAANLGGGFKERQPGARRAPPRERPAGPGRRPAQSRGRRSPSSRRPPWSAAVSKTSRQSCLRQREFNKPQLLPDVPRQSNHTLPKRTPPKKKKKKKKKKIETTTQPRIKHTILIAYRRWPAPAT